ncbi:hypothetical protein M422DRAFT_781979 [Sphaerobolus stellatus SS14]|uniref:WD40 repeat-like protein n=1 Tax=Sphaerobolus stellatus (strain SS14) TaxID=990650 RepID=A0A0C9V5U6_SPHS4|nr:hypothetical protein M422DRAFT_781979 [Sphaerobolus stellatus SS14]
MADLSGEMCSHMEAITSTIGVFVEVGVPTIRFAQKHTAANLLNLSTIATFFSAVTATTIQFSFNLLDGPTQNAVNAFWFSSLVFSIASAVNSLLGLTWKQAIYRSPRHRVPWWVSIWIKRSPLIFLVISVAAFMVGLVLFTWGSNQHRSTCILTTLFTIFSSFGLIAVSAWFAFERYAYARHKGQRWLADILADLNVDFHRYTGLYWLEDNVPLYLGKVKDSTGKHVGKVTSKTMGVMKSGARITSKIFCALRPKASDSEPDIENGDGDENEKLPMPAQMQQSRQGSIAAPTPRLTMGSISPRHYSNSNASVTFRTESPLQMTSPTLVVSSADDPATPSTSEPAKAPPKRRLANLVRSVIMLQNASGPTPSSRKSSGLMNAVKAFETGARPRKDSSETFTVARLTRIMGLKSSLQHLELHEELQPHQALVRHLQFSPNGKWLATCSWDRTSNLYKVGYDEQFAHHRTLAHPQGFVHQVAWSPKGTHLLTKLQRGVKIWTDDGVCIKTIDRKKNVQSVAWLPSGKEFLLVEGHEVSRIDLTGTLTETYILPRLWTHDVAVTPDEERMLAVGTLTQSPDGLQPHKTRKEKRILVYNFAEKQIESQVPVLHSVRDVTIAKGGQMALVSYEDKAPPQLWRLDKVNDDIRLNLRHTYVPTADIDFVGTSYFGGKEDQLILCAAKNGHIHIWDRETATLLHDIRMTDGDLTGIAWNNGSDMPMFSTGSHDGAVKIWASSMSLNSESKLASRAPSSARPSRSQSPTRSESPPVSPLVESPGPISGFLDVQPSGYLDVQPPLSPGGGGAGGSAQGGKMSLVRSTSWRSVRTTMFGNGKGSGEREPSRGRSRSPARPV